MPPCVSLDRVPAKFSAPAEKYRPHLLWLDLHLSGWYLDEITGAPIDRITDIRVASSVRNATVNRLLEVVRAILRRARDDWTGLDRAPRIRRLQGPMRRVRSLDIGVGGPIAGGVKGTFVGACFFLASGLCRRLI